mgnify:CR=1 FL=1
MDKYIDRFPQQLLEAVEIGLKVQSFSFGREIKHIVVSGMGGSGIGGLLVKDVLKHTLAIPFEVSNDYQLPSSCNQHTLVICSSYSGNTEETMSAMLQAFKKNAQIVCITSGGLIKEYADTNEIDYVLIDSGSPPRAAFGQSFVQIFFILHYLGLIENKFVEYTQNAIALLEEDKEEIMSLAKSYAERLSGKMPVIYSDSKFEGVSIRFRQQINENSKMLCWHHVVPEMNHNELVGWREKNEKIAVVFLRNNKDFERNQERMEFTKEVVSQYASDVIEIYSKGDYDLVRCMYLIHITDWVSFYLSELKGVDAIEINVITKLKNKLAENPF